MPAGLETYLSPEVLTSWGIMIAKAIAILIVGWIVAGWAGRLVANATRKANVDEALARFLGSMARYTFIFATVIAAAGAVGIETTSLTAIFASAGLAVGLALQGSPVELRRWRDDPVLQALHAGRRRHHRR